MQTIVLVLNLVSKLIAAALITAMILIAAVLIVAHMHGWQFLSVQSNSMVSSFGKGDMLVVKPVIDIPLGAVVSYRSPKSSQLIISHRLIEKQASGLLVTAGDANRSHDVPFRKTEVVGQALAVVPGAGILLDALRRPLGMALLVYAPALGILLYEVCRLQANLRNLQYRIAGYQR
jgi:signal peptidase I